MKRCQDCKFAEAITSSRSADEWLERAEVLGRRADKIILEHDTATKGFWKFLAPPTLYPSHSVNKLRSEQFEALAKANSIKNRMMCTRFPEHIEVNKTHHCGEFTERNYT